MSARGCFAASADAFSSWKTASPSASMAAVDACSGTTGAFATAGNRYLPQLLLHVWIYASSTGQAVFLARQKFVALCCFYLIHSVKFSFCFTSKYRKSEERAEDFYDFQWSALHDLGKTLSDCSLMSLYLFPSHYVSGHLLKFKSTHRRQK